MCIRLNFDEMRIVQLLLSLFLSAAFVFDAVNDKGFLFCFYALITLLLVIVLGPVFKTMFKTKLPDSLIIVADIFVVFCIYIGNRFDLYHRFFAYDILLHLLSGVLIVLAFYEVFFPLSYREYVPLGVRIALMAVIGLAAAGFWELAEYFFDILTGFDVQRNLVVDTELLGKTWQNPGLRDSMNDMINGTIGGIIGSVVIFIRERMTR